MTYYRKKPVEVEAQRWDGTIESSNWVLGWIGKNNGEAFLIGPDRDLAISIITLEGNMHATPGDWIIKGIQGEFYPCKPDIFDATYEEV